MRRDDRLLRSYRAGRPGAPGYLDDHAFMADGLIELHTATGDAVYLQEATELAEAMIAGFMDRAGGGFHLTADHHEELFTRARTPTDSGTPSGNAVAARVLLRLAHTTGRTRYTEIAVGTLSPWTGLMARAPQATGQMLAAAAEYLAHAEEAAARTDDTPDARSRRQPVSVVAFLSHYRVRPGDSLQVAVRLRVDEGWHVNSHRPLQDYLTPTSLVLAPSSAGQLRDVAYPPGVERTFGFSDEALSVYEGEAWLLARVMMPGDAEGAAMVEFSLRTQACDERSCQAPTEQILRAEVLVTPDAPAGPVEHRAVFERLPGWSAGDGEPPPAH
jgi:hypothetical protein